jgi:1,4-dihydroxy-6-naphthoate synthase
MAFEEDLDIAKLSYHALYHLCDKYDLLSSGSALGFGNGPLLVAKKRANLNLLQDLQIAIPGKYTSAHFLLNYAFPKVQNTRELLFSDIVGSILDETVDAGVIIHETRFTYEDYGLVCLADLGQIWEDQTGAPIPLGCYAASKSVDQEMASEISRMITASICYADEHRAEILPFMQCHAQELDEKVIWEHVDMFVNEHSKSLTEISLNGIDKMFKTLNSIKNQSNSYHLIH